MPEKEPQFFRTEEGGAEVRPEKPIFEILEERAKIAESGAREISPEEKKMLFSSAERISSNVPGVVVVGGTALRIYLEHFGKKVLEEFGKDIDCILEKESYERAREALPPKKGREGIPPYPDKLFSPMKKEKLRYFFEREEGEEMPDGRREFLKDPENHMALKDKQTHYHIDMFPQQEITTGIKRVRLGGRRGINLLSPEELLMRRMSSIKRGMEEGNLQRRHVIYFYLNGSLIREKEMDKLWEKVRVKKEDVKDWREVWLELDREIQRAEAEGKITEKIAH